MPSPDVIDAVADIEEVEDAPEGSAADYEETHAQSDAAGQDIDALVMMDGATPEQIEAAAHADELVPEADDDFPPSAAERPVEHAEASAEAARAEAVASEVGQPEGFIFHRNGRATRFVWRIDAEGRFSEVSREFAEAVGPHATKVTGVAFADIARHFNLDPDGKIAELLARRDTWSGRTIYWPVEKTSLMVPVDLAALPTLHAKPRFRRLQRLRRRPPLRCHRRSDEAWLDVGCRGRTGSPDAGHCRKACCGDGRAGNC